MGDEQPAPKARKEPKGAADLANRMGALVSSQPPAATPAAGRSRSGSSARTTSARAASAAGRKPASNPGRGTKTVSTSAAAAMPAEQAKPQAFYSARVSHATTPEQLAELEQIRLTENTARRAARRPAISITAMLRAAVAVCLEDDRLKARMIKRAGEEWN